MTVSSAVPGRPTESSEPQGWASWTAASCGPEPALRTAAPGLRCSGARASLPADATWVNPGSRDASLSPASRGQPQMQVDRRVCFLQTLGVWGIFLGTCLPPSKQGLR